MKNKSIKQIKFFNYCRFSLFRKIFYIFLHILKIAICNLVFVGLVALPVIGMEFCSKFTQGIFGEHSQFLAISISIYLTSILGLIISLSLNLDRYNENNLFVSFKKIRVFGIVTVGTIFTESLILFIATIVFSIISLDKVNSLCIGLLIYSAFFFGYFLYFISLNDEGKISKYLKGDFVVVKLPMFSRINYSFGKNLSKSELTTLEEPSPKSSYNGAIYKLLNKEYKAINRLKKALLFNDVEETKYCIKLLNFYINSKGKRNSIKCYRDLQLLTHLIMQVNYGLLSSTDNICLFSELLQNILKTLNSFNSKYFLKILDAISAVLTLNKDDSKNCHRDLDILYKFIKYNKSYINEYLKIVQNIYEKNKDKVTLNIDEEMFKVMNKMLECFVAAEEKLSEFLSV